VIVSEPVERERFVPPAVSWVKRCRPEIENAKICVSLEESK